MRIETPSSFSFPATVGSHGWYLLSPFQWDAKRQVLSRPESLGGRVRDLRIRATGDAMMVEGAPDSKELRRKLGRMFQLGVDVDEFHVAARSSPAHAWTAEARFGRLLCGSTLFEDAVKIIATTNTTWRQTARMVSLLVGKCGRRSSSGSIAFPEPADVAGHGEAELQDECRLGYRARSVHALASGVVSGSIDLEAIADSRQSTADLFRSYRSLPGIGPYGAAHLMAMDGRYDMIAVDSEFRRFVRETYHGGRRVSDSTMLRRYRRWGKWKYLAYWSELWRSVADRLQSAELPAGSAGKND